MEEGMTIVLFALLEISGCIGWFTIARPVLVALLFRT